MGKNVEVAYPSGFTIRPISTGTIVEAHYMPGQYVPDEVNFPTEGRPRPLYYFSLANAHAGCCDTGNVGSGEPPTSIKAGRCISVGIEEDGLVGSRPDSSNRKN